MDESGRSVSHANVMTKHFNINIWKRQIAGLLYIKERLLTLNINNKSVPLKLLN